MFIGRQCLLLGEERTDANLPRWGLRWPLISPPSTPYISVLDSRIWVINIKIQNVQDQRELQ